MSITEKSMQDKKRAEERILRFSFVGSLLFTITEVIMAVVLHSYTVLMDGVFDVADLILLGPFLVLIPLLYKPVTEKHPYGFAQVESVFLIIKYGVLLVVICLMIYENVRVILQGGHTVDVSGVAVYEMMIGFLCLAAWLILRRLSKKYTTPTIQSEVFLWKQDVVNSMGISVAFFAQSALKDTSLSSLAPYMDSVFAIVMAVFLLREPVASLVSGFRKLVLFAPDEETMQMIRAAVETSLENYPYTCSFLDVIQTGRKVWIEVYLTQNPDSSLVDISHWSQIRRNIRKSLTGKFDQIYVELIPDIKDPAEAV
ncbi:MAG: cation transporter [Lachnospiraceae bacterium]|nr:cation transporter [Eubacterium sp.]MCI6795929.1 cation transporter [Lachnospiraceae bacterium]MDD6684816.1 cation transporter [Lachnospiraceae bacterium]MDD7048675.1 cation transporter [Lachnospiraceae bacterium]